MHVKEIWRYPVKSMAGERVAQALITPLGIEGDRNVLVTNARGRVITARSHPGLLGHHATIGTDGTPLVDGQPWNSPGVLKAVRMIAGPDAVLVHDEGPYRFDILPLLVATDGAIAAFGKDGRRLRPNIIIGGVEGLAERDWPGRSLRIGGLKIHLDSLRGRCVMTTYDPDTLEHNAAVLRDIYNRFGGELALNASAENVGIIAEGQLVELE